jgi:hypothetical protein
MCGSARRCRSGMHGASRSIGGMAAPTRCKMMVSAVAWIVLRKCAGGGCSDRWPVVAG